ncbi:MAG: hypothetical protein ACU84Q_13285 [Gammaproteobacteria bacterium]
MKTIIAITAIGAAIVSGSASAADFAPWNETRVDAKIDVQQADVEIRSYYRANQNDTDVMTGEPQADIKIAPWYSASRV